MAHFHHIEDGGEWALCSDACHRQWCSNDNGPYEGWSGCHELETTDYCASCGVVLPGFQDACKCQQNNIVVNRLPREDDELCEHGNIIQLGDTRDAKMNKWTYDTNATHGWIIFREGGGVNGTRDSTGLIGTSEWAWSNEENMKALCKLLNDNNFIAPSEEKQQDAMR